MKKKKQSHLKDQFTEEEKEIKMKAWFQRNQ